VTKFDSMLYAEQILFPFPDRPTAWGAGRMRGEELRTLAAMLLGEDADQIIMGLLGRNERVVEQMWEPYYLVPRYLAIAITRLCRATALINQLCVYGAEVPQPPELALVHGQLCSLMAAPANLMAGCREEELYGEFGNALAKLVVAQAKKRPYDLEPFQALLGRLEQPA
jgi:hypothetical protein